MVLQGQIGGSLEIAFLPGTRVLFAFLLLTFLDHSRPFSPYPEAPNHGA